MKNYIIVVPSFGNGKSAGVRALHVLADYLIENGYKVSLFSYKPYLDKYSYVEKITDEMKLHDIIVYPESVAGNPLGFQNVARWVLYFPGIVGGEKNYHHSEEVFAWTQKYYENVPILNFPMIDKNIFYNDNRPKKHNSYFVYKGEEKKNLPETQNAIRIDMNFPKNREELGELLRNTDTLYSFDTNSALLDEALVCGAKVKIFSENTFIDYKENFEEINTNSAMQLKVFIEKTQEMNYKGKPQPYVSNFFRRILYKYRVISGKIFKNHKKVFRYTLRY